MSVRGVSSSPPLPAVVCVFPIVSAFAKARRRQVFETHGSKKKGIPLHHVITVMRTCAAAVGAVSAVVACAIACAIAGVQVGLVVELEEIFGAPGGYSGALEVTGAPWKWQYAS